MTQKNATLDLPTFGKPAHRSPGKPPEAVANPGASPTVNPGPNPAVNEVGMMTTSATALPALPKGKRPSFSRHRNEANASRAIDLLAEVQQTVEGWHHGLRQVLSDIQAVYQSGPMVEGWLEAVTPTTEAETLSQADTTLLRHGDPAQLAAYVERLSQTSPPIGSAPTQYRLCSLDAEGRLQCQLCPPEQLGAISQAIARHQKLRQLLHQKQLLESRLKQAADALESVHLALGLSGTETP
jgi:hypothetical protein